MKGYMYILKCCDDSYYVGSTKYLGLRIQQHQDGDGANHTKKRLPIELVYFEEFDRIDKAFYREKQVQGWSRIKKEALINGASEKLHELAKCLNETSHEHFKPTSAPLSLQEDADENSGSLSLRDDAKETSGLHSLRTNKKDTQPSLRLNGAETKDDTNLNPKK